MFGYPELEENISKGETSVVAKLLFDGIYYDITGEFSHRWKRKEVDGQLTTDLPLETVTFIMSRSQIPEEAARADWVKMRFFIDGDEYKVRYATGANPVTFYLELPTNIVGEEAGEFIDESTEEDDDTGGIVL